MGIEGGYIHKQRLPVKAGARGHLAHRARSPPLLLLVVESGPGRGEICAGADQSEHPPAAGVVTLPDGLRDTGVVLANRVQGVADHLVAKQINIFFCNKIIYF